MMLIISKSVEKLIPNTIIRIVNKNYLLIIFISLQSSIINVNAQADSIEFPSIAAAPSGSTYIPDLNSLNACAYLSFGEYGVNSANTTFTVYKYCGIPDELNKFSDAGYGYNNCTPNNPYSPYTLEDTCNWYWPTVPVKSEKCPKGYWLSAGHMCKPYSNTVILDKNLGSNKCIEDGNPINASTGVKFYSETDFIAAPNTTLMFKRNYNSRQGQFVSTLAENRHWRHHYERQLLFKDWQSNLVTIIAIRSDGKSIFFTSLNGQWIVDNDISDQLIEIKDTNNSVTGWRYYNSIDDLTEIYNLEGKLVSVMYQNGRTETLGYDTNQNLVTVSDDTGRSLTFTYDGSARINTLTDPAGGLYQYTYSTNGNLTSVTYPDNTIRTYHYNESAYTNNTNLPNALTGITDEKGIRYATYTYDAQGRAVITEHAGGADKHTLTYSTDGSNTITTDPLGVLIPVTSKPSSG